MSLASALIPELDQEFSTTLRVLERVPEDKFGWKPHESAASLQGLSWHIAHMLGLIVDMAGLDVLDFEPAMVPGPPAALAEVLAEAKQGHAKLRDYLAGLDDRAAMGDWTLRIDGRQIMTIPRIVLIRSVGMNHVYHHRGQLSVYLRMLEVPVPSIYGPSADENPWA